ncbi:MULTISPECIES: DUF4296 domain-containing protein [Aestuariibaculum]|uniref:DUF4296 domain-containing protein n=1 Tax=Aestuariibaculum lutulentum TaxID=2920935 RepID=A0ABS9RFT1_9FLAO|nr:MULTISPECIES: DUF4296 domain-containing protein [Aestuariibaculum]MCH4551804.1 DUF4296 domain-containing protein [Aestuariibaculum lutulentum]MCR8666911.1 DUF4296 domain-containing protein [Aestuariibaculum sp. M13]
MLKQFITYLGVILIATSCGNLSGPKKPENLIPKDKMINILIDARLVGSVNGTNKRFLEDRGYDLKNYVFEKHGIDSLQFAESNDYYTYHIKQYQDIFDKAIDSLDRLKEVLEKKQDEEQKIRRRKELDSIRKLEKVKDSLINSEKKKIDKEEIKAEGVLAKPLLEKDTLPQ